MKDPKEEAKRWFKQARYDLKEAEESLRRKSFAYACFFAEQASQKFLKAYLIFKGKRFITIHSISHLLEEAIRLDKRFRELLDEGKKLDRYYLVTRYPDTLPAPAVPYETYTQEEASEALEIAKKIANATRLG